MEARVREAEGGLLTECRAAYDRWAAFSGGKWGVVAVFAWAAAEATVWPIIPDFLLVPVSACAGRKFCRPLCAAIAGATLGGLVAFLMSGLFPGFAWGVLRLLPFAGQAHIGIALDSISRHGILSYFYQPWSGVPFKTWAVAGGMSGLTSPLVVPAFVLGRGVRMAIFSGAARVLGWRFRGFLRDYSLFAGLVYLVLFFFGWWQVVS